MSTTKMLGIEHIPSGTLDPAAALNLALDDLDALASAGVVAVLDMVHDEPPPVASDGEQYIVASPAQGDWLYLDGHLVRYLATPDAWQSWEPGTHFRMVLDLSSGLLYRWNGARFVAISGGAAGDVVEEPGTSRAITPADAGTYIRFTDSSAKTCSFDGAEGFVAGQQFPLRNVGAGTLTLSSSGGLTLNPPTGGALTVAQGGTAIVRFISDLEADVVV